MFNTTVSLNTTWCGEPLSLYHQLITYSDHALTLMTLVAAIITVVTITENLALAAALVYQRLTQSGSTSVTSLVVLAMAVSDTLMATLVMPLAVLELGLNGRWGLGQGACVMRYALDICWCTLSVYHVATIAVDRYFAVCRPLLYRSLTLKSGFLLLSVCWVLSLFLAVLPISAGWFQAKEVSVSSCGQTFLVCVPVNDPTTMLWTFSFSFFTPIVFIFSLYFAIVKQLMKIHTINTSTYVSKVSIKVQRSNLSQSTIPAEISKSSQISLQNSPETSEVNRDSQGGVSRDSQGGVSRDSQSGVSRDSQGGVSRDSQGGVSLDSQGGVSRDWLGCSTSAKTFITPVCGRQEMFSQRKTSRGTMQDRTKDNTQTETKSKLRESKTPPNVEKHVKIGKRNMKAIRNIGILLLCFVLCWLPFSVTVPICIYHGRVLPRWGVVLLSWLGYTNSTINPILLCGNKTIRAALWALVARVRCRGYSGRLN